jgi:hypothetical protein
MGQLVVTEFMTLDGVIEDPGGAEGTPRGGWSFRFPAPDGEAVSSRSCSPATCS